MTAVPEPFVSLGVKPLTGPMYVRWAPGIDTQPGAAIAELGSIHIFTYSEDQAAALEAVFAEARRMHAAEGGQT